MSEPPYKMLAAMMMGSSFAPVITNQYVYNPSIPTDDFIVGNGFTVNTHDEAKWGSSDYDDYGIMSKTFGSSIKTGSSLWFQSHEFSYYQYDVSARFEGTGGDYVKINYFYEYNTSVRSYIISSNLFAGVTVAYPAGYVPTQTHVPTVTLSALNELTVEYVDSDEVPHSDTYALSGNASLETVVVRWNGYFASTLTQIDAVDITVNT